MTEDQAALPCTHGRLPMNGEDGWKHCPHCLGLNAQPNPSEAAE